MAFTSLVIQRSIGRNYRFGLSEEDTPLLPVKVLVGELGR